MYEALSYLQVMPEPFTMTLDLDFGVWSEDLEHMWKRKVPYLIQPL